MPYTVTVTVPTAEALGQLTSWLAQWERETAPARRPPGPAKTADDIEADEIEYDPPGARGRDELAGDFDADAPTDGRQLMGWAGKQRPDKLGSVKAWGKKSGYPTKIIEWDHRQVSAAYNYARSH